MARIALIPQFKPPQTPFNGDGYEVRRPSAEEPFGEYAVPIFGFEFETLGKPKNWTLIQFEAPTVHADSVVAACDLISSNWPYLRRRTKRLRVPFGGKQPPYPLPTRFTWTDRRRDRLAACMRLMKSRPRFGTALHRWHTSATRPDGIDSVLDLCSALEALYRLPNELRLRLSFAVYHTLKRRRREGFKSTYEMYGKRSAFIHGTSDDSPTDDQVDTYVDTVADVLLSALNDGDILSSEMLSSNILSSFALGR